METQQKQSIKASDVFRKLEQIADISALSKEDRIKYDECIKVYRDRLAVTAYAEETGRAKGFAQGRAEGCAEGRAEVELKIARNLKQMGLPTETIAQATGLTADVIEQL